MSAEELRKKYPEFVYESFRYFREGGGLAMAFRFKIEPDIVFNPKIKIHGVDWGRVERLPLGTLENLAFHIGLAEMPSYWKCTVSPRIVIKAGKLTGAQIRWWKNLIMNGLAEFFYVNRIAPTKNFLNIKSDSGKAFSCVPCVEEKNRKILLPVGGGKDSLVAIELLKTLGEGFGTMVLGNVPASFNLIKACGAPTPVKISRKIDKKLLELNRKGYLNGHTPFSSCLAFLGTCCAEIFGYGYVAVANERSANEPTITAGGKRINHQYSKSYEFEKLFRAYAKSHLTKNVEYFSALRPLYELQIAKIAASFPRELQSAKSCNVGAKTNAWCGNCPKCLGVFLLLYSFLGAAMLTKIFGKNLFSDKKLSRFIPALIGHSESKPFDCVATIKENRAALTLSCKKPERKPYILKQFCGGAKSRASESEINGIMRSWDKKNFLPQNIEKKLKALMRRAEKSEKNNNEKLD